jgi:hypothetical protein
MMALRSRRPAALGDLRCDHDARARRHRGGGGQLARGAAAIVIEFAALPVGPAVPQTEIAPGPEQVMSEASPGKPVERVEDEQKVEEKVASRPLEEPPLPACCR